MKGSLMEGWTAQFVFNVFVPLIGAGCLWWVNTIWSMTKVLQQQVNELHIELAKNYVPRQELQRTFDRLFTKLDEIQNEMRSH